MKTLKQKLLDANVPIDCRYSDLQCADIAIARQIIREHRKESIVCFQANAFTCNRTGQPWLELPLMNEDYFIEQDKRRQAK